MPRETAALLHWYRNACRGHCGLTGLTFKGGETHEHEY